MREERRELLHVVSVMMHMRGPVAVCLFFVLGTAVCRASLECRVRTYAECDDLCDRGLSSPVVRGVVLTGPIANFRCAGVQWEVS
jgi:hypothetical protein